MVALNELSLMHEAGGISIWDNVSKTSISVSIEEINVEKNLIILEKNGDDLNNYSYLEYEYLKEKGLITNKEYDEIKGYIQSELAEQSANEENYYANLSRNEKSNQKESGKTGSEEPPAEPKQPAGKPEVKEIPNPPEFAGEVLEQKPKAPEKKEIDTKTIRGQINILKRLSDLKSQSEDILDKANKLEKIENPTPAQERQEEQAKLAWMDLVKKQSTLEEQLDETVIAKEKQTGIRKLIEINNAVKKKIADRILRLQDDRRAKEKSLQKRNELLGDRKAEEEKKAGEQNIFAGDVLFKPTRENLQSALKPFNDAIQKSEEEIKRNDQLLDEKIDLVVKGVQQEIKLNEPETVVSEMTDQELNSEGEKFDKIIKDREQNLINNNLPLTGSNSGISTLTEPEFNRHTLINDEIQKRQSVSLEEAKKRVSEKRAEKRKQAENKGKTDENDVSLLYEKEREYEKQFELWPEKTPDGYADEKSRIEAIEKTGKLANALHINVGRRTANALYPKVQPRTVLEGFKESGGVDFVGQKVTSSQDIADLWSIHRSPYIEKAHAIFVKDGIIVGTTAMTCNKLGKKMFPKLSLVFVPGIFYLFFFSILYPGLEKSLILVPGKVG